MTDPNSQMMHASAVAVNDQAVLLCGPSGSGKSSLALQLIALGGQLIADDRCVVSAVEGDLWVSSPPSLPPLIEARGVGLLKVPTMPQCRVSLVVNMDKPVTERLPEPQFTEICGHQVKMMDKSEAAHFPSAVLLYLKHGIAT